MSDSSYRHITYEVSAGVGCVTLNRPDVLNSLHLEMAREVQNALAIVASDETVRAVLLTGAGRGFCAGQDLASVPLNGADGSFELADTVRAQYNPIVLAIRRLPKPVVCAVNGVAAGAGANLAFACDIVIAANEATFIQSFSRIGLIPDSGGTFILPRLAGFARASGLALLGDKLTAAQAREWGLIWDTCDLAELPARSRAMAERLATQPTAGFALIKQALNASLTNGLEAQLELEAVLQSAAGRTEDFREGVAAFREKRTPAFRGR